MFSWQTPPRRRWTSNSAFGKKSSSGDIPSAGTQGQACTNDTASFEVSLKRNSSQPSAASPIVSCSSAKESNHGDIRVGSMKG